MPCLSGFGLHSRWVSLINVLSRYVTGKRAKAHTAEAKTEVPCRVYLWLNLGQYSNKNIDKNYEVSLS